MNGTVPEVLRNFRVYEDGVDDMIGLSDVELPTFEAPTEDIKGPGIAGTIAAPVLGHFNSMETKFNWRTILNKNVSLAEPKAHHLDIRGDQQVYDPKTGEYKTSAIKVLVVGTPKNTELGKLDMGTKTDTSNTLEISYIKVTIDGKTMAEIDKYNYVCVINGVDYLKGSREALGLA